MKTTPEELANECAENIYVNARTKEDSAELILDNIPLKELLDVARAAKELLKNRPFLSPGCGCPECNGQLALQSLQQKGIEL